MRYGVRGGDETLKKGVEAKFTEGEAVWELASAEGLEPQDGDTLRAFVGRAPFGPRKP